MSAPAKLAAFAVVLAVLFGVGAVAGGATDPSGDEPRSERAGAGSMTEGAHGGAAKEDAMSTASHTGERQAHPVRGLAVAENGMRIELATPELRRGATEQLRFRIVDERGRAVRAFDVEHERRMHLIVARRDLTGFQHLHPKMNTDGEWSTEVRLDDAGSYRMFADFSAGDETTTLASDLRVDGAADLRPLPRPKTTAVSDGGYDVRLAAPVARHGEEAELRFTVTKDGRPVDTEPYLGAGGHLVALREGDLAFLHVHPTEHGDGIGFEATFPTTGAYRLFLQFQVDGEIQTVAFTQEVA
ncbi:MAG: hypothetical protein JHC95_01700 [Solirubrobacteraceae bacterium]|nr:hypothetical protein [Solirubrobacteraceae bacterium]